VHVPSFATHVSSFVVPNGFPMPIAGRGAVGIFAATLAQSGFQPDQQQLRWRLRSERYGPLLATDTLPDGTLYTMPETGGFWWGLCDRLVLERRQTQASHMRACLRSRRGGSR
jgi:hypothetical protein